MTNDKKKYRTAADALYGLRDWASEQRDKYDKEEYLEHKKECQECKSGNHCPLGVAYKIGDEEIKVKSFTFDWVADKIDDALQDVFGNFQKDHPLHDPWDGETWTFFSPSGKGAIVMRDGQDNLKLPDINVLNIAGQLLYSMLFATNIAYTWKTEIETPDGQSVVIAEGVGGHLKTYHQLAAALAHVAKRGGAA